MTLSSAKQKFIKTWGDLSSAWGIPKSMAQIHALLLISPKAMDVKSITQFLDISIGNANTNLRNLMEWQLIYKTKGPNKRKDYYQAEKDMWNIFSRILAKRKKQELDPITKSLDELLDVSNDCQESKEFCRMIRSLKQLTSATDHALDFLLQSDSDWVLKSWSQIVK